MASRSRGRARRAAPRRAALAALSALAALTAAATSAAPEATRPEPEPGEVIDHENVRRYRHLLPEHVLRFVRDGAWFGAEGRVALRVGPTRPAPPPTSYRDATRRHHAEARLDEEGLVEGWTAGFPFPDPEPPRLGAKILWNQYYRWRGDDYVIDTYRTIQTDGSGNRRETRGVFQLLTVSGRTDRGGPPELPHNAAGLRTVSKLVFTHPPESRWTTTLFHRYEDAERDDDAWVYLPSTRRVLRVQSGRRCTPVRGSTFTPDDFFGFDGRVWEHEWRVVREGRALALVHQESIPTELDERGVWPVGERWELRDVWVVEGIPKDDDYCYGKRRLWIDRESFNVLHAEVWDRKGEFWKGFLSTYAHDEVGHGEAAPVWGGTGGYDFQTRYVTYVTVGEPEVGTGYRISDTDLDRHDFTPNALLRRGR